MQKAAWFLVLIGLVVALASARGTLVPAITAYASGGQIEQGGTMPRTHPSSTGITVAPAQPPTVTL
jgi:hypothetical protein